MPCSNCGFNNPNGMKFCGQCGTLLRATCRSCNFHNPANFNFCGQCGAPLSSGAQPAIPPVRYSSTSSSQPSHEAERRQLTVMFCDLVGSTALSEQLDPEELREVVRAYQQVAAELIDRFEGHIAQYLGDGLLVYFGYPQAHENDAQRALLAGLGIISEMEQLNNRLQQGPLRLKILPLRVRIGIHTGLVVVGDIGSGDRHEQLALGDTTNIAARLQQIAGADTIVISAATYRLVEGFFSCHPLGLQMLKGISRPTETYQVLHASRVYNRLEAALSANTGLTPLVGRSQEISLLLGGWARAKAGQGQVVLLEGEAGIGKSRLVQVLKERLTGEPHTWLPCYGSPYYRNSRLYPITELLERLLHFKRKDTAEQKLDKLKTALELYGMPLSQTIPLFAALLSIPLPSSYKALNLPPQRQKQQTIEAFVAILLQLSQLRPIIIVVEDLHWADPSTLEMLDTLIDQMSNLRVFTLFSFRPEFSPSWTPRSSLTHLNLARLPRQQVEDLIVHLVGDRTLPAEVYREIITRTDGVPIFVEELTKAVLELEQIQKHKDCYPQAGASPHLSIPASLHDSLMARLDRLGPVREVAQLGATLGRTFSYQLLSAISPLDDDALQESLVRLVEAELLHQHGLPPQATYTFKHALVQDAAYRSLLRRTRRHYHQQIAEALSEELPEVAQAEPELLAHHYTAAGLIQPAVNYWQQAGRRAVEYSANLEAINHFRQALELLVTLPETPQRIEQELQLQIALGAPLLMTKGYGSPEVEAVYDRARVLARQLGNTPQISSVLFGLWVFYLARARHQTALELAQELMDLAEQAQEPTLWLEAHQALGISYVNLGRLILARDHLEQGLALYDARQHGLRHNSAHIGADRGVACSSHLALTLWLLGYPDQALIRCQNALALADELDHPYSKVFALFFATWLHQYRREASLVRDYAVMASSLAREHSFTLLETLASIMEGWALTEQGQLTTGLNQMFDDLADYHATGAQIGQLHILVLLAEAHSKLEQIDEGLAILTGALQAIEEKNEWFCESELYRLQGELLFKQAESAGAAEQAALMAKAEERFQQAIRISHQQQTKSLELRAALGLCQLYCRQEQPNKAAQILAASYGWFSEGFDTVDLKEARKRLDALIPDPAKPASAGSI